MIVNKCVIATMAILQNKPDVQVKGGKITLYFKSRFTVSNFTSTMTLPVLLSRYI
ncbi:hypothetical protein PPEP_a0622 [Pseudoalteromonas peptidolytica F12-50-A1]|uniref:Uncharacterized protein n=1 Tax=Pseudoalteromonas peptidolytica F12-50-A1 TaxID=1315280 RepID=A0A8I0T3X2_9GAMM|nr:hypothetical protein [Pseudoalteromonas peptidolytica F12-50-A1]